MNLIDINGYLIVVWCHNLVIIYFRFFLNEYDNYQFGIIAKAVDTCAIHLLLMFLRL